MPFDLRLFHIWVPICYIMIRELVFISFQPGSASHLVDYFTVNLDSFQKRPFVCR
jgi:hypothetical protein